MRIFIYECVSAGGLGRDVADSLRREGRAMLDAVGEDFRRMPGIDVVTLHDETRAGAFAQAAASCAWTLVIAPEFDDLLQSRSQQVRDAGGRLLGSQPGAIGLTADKLAMADFWKERGVAHPRTQVLDRAAFTAFAPPWVLKPRFGAGSQATFLIRDRAVPECPEGEFIVQQYVPGQAASVAVLISDKQTIPLLPARQHLSNDGRFCYLGGSLPLPTALAERATRLALQAVAGIESLRGYVGVDLVLGEDGADHAIEINPRLTTSYIGLRKMCKQNLADLMLRMALGEVVSAPAWSAVEVRFGVERVSP